MFEEAGEVLLGQADDTFRFEESGRTSSLHFAFWRHRVPLSFIFEMK
jgi:hypothetical protein